MIVAFGAPQLNPQKQPGRRIREQVRLRLEILAVGRDEPGLRIVAELALGGQQLAGDRVPAAAPVELLRKPGRERIADRLGAAFVAGRDQLVPNRGEVLAVGRRVEEPVDRVAALGGIGAAQKLDRLFVGRNPTGDVERDAPQKLSNRWPAAKQ